MKKAFTILELMLVVAIIGILLGIVVTTSTNSIKLSRTQRAKALCVCVKQGLDNYRAQKDRFPGTVGDRIDNDGVLVRSNTDGFNNQSIPDRYELDGTEVRSMVRELVEESVFHANPMMDVSVLFVSDRPGEPGGRDYGYDFPEAVRGSKRRRRKMSVGEMYFGYPETGHGWFRRFKMVYLNTTQEMEVGSL